MIDLFRYSHLPSEIIMKKSITLLGMSGVGKTTLSQKLPTEKWFHYSGDYRIATHYLNDSIRDFLIEEAMKSPVIAHLLKNDAINVQPKLAIDNLAAVSAYIGKLGNPALGGFDWETFIGRQHKHREAEIAACYDVGVFKEKAQSQGYDYFLHDAGGSICELDDQAVIDYLGKETEFVYLHADDDLAEAITQRALAYPKPIYYNEAFLTKQLSAYGEAKSINHIEEMTPDDFIQFVIPKLMQHRRERYLAIAEKHGKIIDAKVAFSIRDERDFLDLLEKK